MSLLFGESFGLSNATADYATYGAISPAANSIAYLTFNTGGPFGDNYLGLTNTYGNSGIGFTPSNGVAAGFFGARVNGTGGYMWPFYDVNKVLMFAVVCSSGGAFSVYTGGSFGTFSGYNTGTLLGATTQALIGSLSAWNYVEIGWVIGTTTGAVTIRINNSIAYTLTGVNTKNTSTTGNVALVGFMPANGATQPSVGITHVYICDSTGSAPNNTFLGDCRGVIKRTTTNDVVAFTPTASAVSLTGAISGATNNTLPANTIAYERLFVNPGGTLLATDMVLATGFTGHAMMNIYADSGLGTGPSGAPLATSVVVTNPTAGTVTFTYSSGPHLTSGSYYWAAILADTSGSWRADTGISNYSYATQSQTYSLGLPTVPQPSTPANAAFHVDVITVPANFDIMASYPPVPASGYTTDSTVGDQDTFNIAASASSLSKIFGVIVKVLANKSDAGNRTLQPVMKSSGIVGLGTATALTATAQQINTIYPLDPNTSVAWTPTGVSAAKIGYKISG